MGKIKKFKFLMYTLSFLVIFLSLISFSWPYSINLTLDAKDDAGVSPILPFPFAKFVYDGGELYVASNEGPFNTKDDVYNYANSKGITNWELISAGNIWSQSDLIVGDYLIGLNPGPYRISVLDGAFMYDSFDWSQYSGKYWWQLHIQARKPTGEPYGSDIILGATDPYDSPDKALSDNLGKYVDIEVPSGGSLVFWIYDTNSLDNSGSLGFNVTLIPAPPTIILFVTGIIFLSGIIRRLKRYRIN